MSTVSAVGDVRVYRDDPDSLFENVREYMHSMDISFCQSESCYSDKGSEGSSGPRGASPNDPHGYPAFARAGFDVVSMASNHTMDWGRDALLDTLERMRADGMQTIGAGAGLEEARTPAIFEHDGSRIAFLGYCSVAPNGYYAVPGRAGVAPLRAITHYEQLENDQPGTPAEVMTWPYEHDLEALVDDVRMARAQADVVFVSLHWGVHWAPVIIADYQPIVAHAVIDAGADAIIGHHPHILKGIEVYKGKPIFYSLGNFAMDTNSKTRPTDQVWRKKLKKAYALWGTPGPYDYRKLKGASYSMVVKLEVADGSVGRVSFRPAVIEEFTPRLVSASDEAGQEVVDYVRDITDGAGLNASFHIDGDDVVIETGASLVDQELAKEAERV